MAERLAYLEAVIGADITQFRKAMRDVRNETGILSETITGISGAARSATFAISAPLATLGTYTVQAASDFDSAMRNINSITGMSEAQLKSLSDEVRAFSSTTRGGAVDAANSLYTVFSAGITDTALAMNTMEVATKTADAGLADMETTTEALVASMLSYGTEVVSAERASNSLTQMVQIGVGSMQNFANSLSKALPSASALGVEIEDLYASMAYMTQRSFSASEAATAINQGMSSLMKPTEEMETAMRSLGVNGVEQLMEKYNTLGNAVKALVDTTDGSSASIAELFSNVRGKRFVDTILNDFETYNKTLQEFNRTVEGATDRAYAEQMKSFSAQFDLMTSAVENASIAIGLELLPLLTPFINKIAEIFTSISTLNPEMLQLGIGMAGIMIVLPPLIWLFTSLLSPLGLLITAVSAVGAQFIASLGDIETAIKDFIDSVPALKNIAEDIAGLKFEAPEAEEIIEPIKVDAFDMVEVPSENASSFLWTSWLNRDNENYSWEQFKEDYLALNGTMVFHVGDLIKIPTGETIMQDAIETYLEPSMDYLTAYPKKWLREARKAEQAVATSLVGGRAIPAMDANGHSWAYPLEYQFLVLQNTLEKNLIPALKDVWGRFVSWIDTAGADLADSLTFLIKNNGNIDVDMLSNFIGDLFNFNPNTALGNLLPALENFFRNLTDWIITFGIPTLLRGAGRLAGELSIWLLDTINDGLLWTINNLGSTVGNFQSIGQSFMAHFEQGFQAGASQLQIQARFLLIFLRLKAVIPKVISTLDSIGSDIIIFFNNMFVDVVNAFSSFLSPKAVSDAIGDVFNFDFKTTFPKITASISALFNNLVNWVFSSGLPILARGFGRLLSEVGIFIAEGFNSLLLTMLQNNSVDSALNTFISSVIDPFVAGVEDAFLSNFGTIDIGQVIVDLVNTALARLETLLYTVAPVVSNLLAQIGSAIQNALPTLDSVFASITSTISRIVGNITGTLDTTSLSTLITTLFNADTLFPDATEELKKLMGKVSTWFQVDALPLIASGVGAFVGNLGILIGQAFGILGAEAQGSVPSVTAGVTESIVEPFMQGYNDALGAFEDKTGDNLNPIDSLLTGLAGMIGTVAILKPDLFLSAASSIGEALLKQLAKTQLVQGILTASSNFMTSLSGLIGGVISSTAFSVVLGTLALAGLLYLLIPEEWIDQFELELARLMGNETYVVNADVSTIIEDGTIDFEVAQAMKDSLAENVSEEIADSFANLQFPVQKELVKLFVDGDVTLDELTVAIGFLDFMFSEGFDPSTSFQEAFQTWAMQEGLISEIAIGQAVDNLVVPLDASNIGFSLFSTNKMVEVESSETFEELIANSSFFTDIDIDKVLSLTKTTLTDAGEAGKSFAREIITSYYQGMRDWMNTGTAGATGELDDTLDMSTGVVGDVVIENVSDFSLIDEEEIKAQAEIAGTNAANGLSDSFSLALATQGYTAEQFNTDFLVPFNTNWDGTFGTEGTVSLTTQAFFTSFGTGMAGMVTSSIMASKMMTAPLNKITLNIQNAMNDVKTALDTARDAVSALLLEIRSLASVSTNLEINVRVTGAINAPTPTGMNTGGGTQRLNSSNANGLEYVPRDGHIAQLHKGEMVVPATIANNLRRIGEVSKSILEGGIGNGGGTVYSTQHNQVNIYGVEDVDSLLIELERRGIYLNG